MKILLALGANLPSAWGSPAETVSKAVEILSERIGGVVDIAPFYVAPAFPPGSGPDFINTAMVVNNSFTPRHVLAICHSLEKDARRTRDNRWGPRTLDIDLLAVDGLVLPSISVFESWRTLPMDVQRTSAPEELILPHPRMQDRAFVLAPLNDIAPDWRHPVLGLTVAEMLNARPAAEKSTLTRVQRP